MDNKKNTTVPEISKNQFDKKVALCQADVVK